MGITLNLNPEVEARLLRDAEASGLAVSAYIEKLLLPERDQELGHKVSPDELRERLTVLARKWHELPTLDDRTPDEIVGYDESGLPTQ